MADWLLKTEPDSYAFADLVRDGGTEWDGVRNHAAARNLRAMAVGDRAFIYHSGDKAVVGTARIARTARPDGDEGWLSVRVEPVEPLARPVPLATLRATPALATLAVLRQPRLSVSPVTGAEWGAIVALGA